MRDVNPDTIEKEIVKLVLEDFRRRLRGPSWLLRVITKSPREGYARQLSKLDERGRIAGNVCGTWYVTYKEVTSLPASYAIPAPTSRIGMFWMFYNQASCDFAVAPDQRSVDVGVQFGPRAGWGIRFTINEEEGGKLKLGSAVGLWKS